MKQAALQALQHVRTTLAYQLTPEAVDSLLEPIQKALDGSGNILEHVALTVPYIAAHNAKVEEAISHMCDALSDEDAGSPEADLAFATIRSLRL